MPTVYPLHSDDLTWTRYWTNLDVNEKNLERVKIANKTDFEER